MPDHKDSVLEQWEKTRPRIGIHYLCRLFLQMRAACEANAFIVVGEDDLKLIEEIGAFILETRLPTPFEIPDLTDKMILGDDFADGLLNFSPRDIKAVVAIRADETVREYAKNVSSAFGQSSSDDGQKKMLEAMVDAYKGMEKREKLEHVFEVSSWLVKPLHYIPLVGELVGVAEDVKDFAAKWAERDREQKEWCLLAVKMTDIGLRDYFKRKGNMI